MLKISTGFYLFVFDAWKRRKVVFKNARPYKEDKMNLPVKNVEECLARPCDSDLEGCFFEMDNAGVAFVELQAQGLQKRNAGNCYGNASWYCMESFV